jgi:hypothetical protein
MLVEPQSGVVAPKPRTRGIFVLALGVVLLATFGIHFTVSSFDCDQEELPAVELIK